MKKKIFLVMALFAVFSVFSIAISAYKGDYNVKGPSCSEDRHELITNAFENYDYDAWYELMTQNQRKSKVLSVVTKENFNLFVDAYNAGKAGDFETASLLRAQLGLNNGAGLKDGNGFKGNQINKQQNNYINSDNLHTGHGKRNGRI
jgi:hypothetical protein